MPALRRDALSTHAAATLAAHAHAPGPSTALHAERAWSWWRHPSSHSSTSVLVSRRPIAASTALHAAHASRGDRASSEAACERHHSFLCRRSQAAPCRLPLSIHTTCTTCPKQTMSQRPVRVPRPGCSRRPDACTSALPHSPVFHNHLPPVCCSLGLPPPPSRAEQVLTPATTPACHLPAPRRLAR